MSTSPARRGRPGQCLGGGRHRPVRWHTGSPGSRAAERHELAGGHPAHRADRQWGAGEHASPGSRLGSQRADRLPAALERHVLPQHLLQFDGQNRTSLPVPSSVQLRSMATDGHGGLWFSAARSSSQAPIAEHRSASGTWSSHPLPTGNGQAFGIALIPGTTSLWASGFLETNGDTGSDAVIWGNGPAA